MPAMLDDPTAPAIYRGFGEHSFPQPGGDSSLPDSIVPRQVTLRDRITTATLLAASSPNHVPASLLSYLTEQLNREIEIGDTYPMLEPLTVVGFGQYWFQNFGAIMVMGDVDSLASLSDMERNGADWSKVCLGSFYIRPNYPGRSSHICTGGFLVTDAARNKGVGRLMGEGYLDWAPRLGYNYSVFNLVYETNVASCRIWDALGFKRIGRVKGAGALRSHPDELIDAIIYGRDLGPEGEDFVSEERFDKIRYYLKHSKYPAGADRAEKSRLRSAATHYKLVPSPDGGEERLMLKDKEVVSDPQRQYEIARQLHAQTHGGINKTTASIAERYHWVRIKETVSLVIKNCPECKESSKTQASRPDSISLGSGNSRKTQAVSTNTSSHDPNRDIERLVNLDQPSHSTSGMQSNNAENAQSRRSRKSTLTKPEPEMPLSQAQEPMHQQPMPQQALQHHQVPQHQPSPITPMHQLRYEDMPLDPQIMTYPTHDLSSEPMPHTMDHTLGTNHLSLAGEHPLTTHQSLSNDHNMNTHSHAPHPDLNNLNINPHALPNDPTALQRHGVDGSMHNVDSGMHGVEHSLGHAVGHHHGMHVGMEVMGHNGFDMSLGHAATTGVNVGTDDRMDADGEEVGGEISHHLMEAGFGGTNHGAS